MRYLTAGESHGPQLTTIIEGMPAGLPVTAEEINAELARRQKLRKKSKEKGRFVPLFSCLSSWSVLWTI